MASRSKTRSFSDADLYPDDSKDEAVSADKAPRSDVKFSGDGAFDRVLKRRRVRPTCAIFIHAGAGYHSQTNEKYHLAACSDAARAGMKTLKDGGTAVDAVESAIKLLEDKEITNAGFGSNLSMDGIVECDATVVDHLGRSGACGAVPNVKNPISLAKVILERSNRPLSLRRVPPNLLVGEGARDFASENGVSVVSNNAMVSRNARDRFVRWREDLVRAEAADDDAARAGSCQHGEDQFSTGSAENRQQPASPPPPHDHTNHRPSFQPLPLPPPRSAPLHSVDPSRDHYQAIMAGTWNEGQPDSPASAESMPDTPTTHAALGLGRGPSSSPSPPLDYMGAKAAGSAATRRAASSASLHLRSQPTTAAHYGHATAAAAAPKTTSPLHRLQQERRPTLDRNSTAPSAVLSRSGGVASSSAITGTADAAVVVGGAASPDRAHPVLRRSIEDRSTDETDETGAGDGNGTAAATVAGRYRGRAAALFVRRRAHDGNASSSDQAPAALATQHDPMLEGDFGSYDAEYVGGYGEEHDIEMAVGPADNLADGATLAGGDSAFMAENSSTTSAPPSPKHNPPSPDDHITDTVGAIAIDLQGNMAAGSSSGGIGMKHRGRVGPAALVGVGTAVIPAADEAEPRYYRLVPKAPDHAAPAQGSAVCQHHASAWQHAGAEHRSSSGGQAQNPKAASQQQQQQHGTSSDGPGSKPSSSVGRCACGKSAAATATRPGLHQQQTDNNDRFNPQGGDGATPVRRQSQHHQHHHGDGGNGGGAGPSSSPSASSRSTTPSVSPGRLSSPPPPPPPGAVNTWHGDGSAAGVSVAAVTSGTGEHMATTCASARCADRLRASTRRGTGGADMDEPDDDKILEGFILDDFMGHPGVRGAHSQGAIGVMAVKKTAAGYYFYFAHNTESFALASYASYENHPAVVMSRLGENREVARGGRKIRAGE